MRFTPFLVILALLSAPLCGQFEQKLSLNLSAGVFNTVGANGYEPDYVSEVNEPTLMPNFKPGFSLSGGLQYNLNRHFSIGATVGLMISSAWYYDYSNSYSDPFNYLYYEIYTDQTNYITEVSGNNEMTLTCINFALSPRYYFMPGKKLNPYIYAGLNITYLDVFFLDNEYKAYQERGREEEYLGDPDQIFWYDNSFDPGIQAGAGVEYTVSDILGVFLRAGYHVALLNQDAFFDSGKYANFNAVDLQLGVRFSFLKSKDL